MAEAVEATLVAPAAPPVSSTAVEAAPVAVSSSLPAPEPAAPAVETPAVPAAVSSPSDAAAAPTELVKPEFKTVEAKPSLLGEGEKPAEKPVEAAPTETPAEPAPTYDIKFPEGIEIAPEEVGKLTSVLGEFKAPPELGQKLADLYISEAQTLADRIRTEEYNRGVEAFETMRDGWRDQFFADPDIGGNRRDTTLRQAASVIEQYAGSPEHATALREMLNLTGAGNHPALIRLLANVGKALGEGKPVVAAKPYTPPPSKASRRYPGMVNGSQP